MGTELTILCTLKDTETLGLFEVCERFVIGRSDLDGLAMTPHPGTPDLARGVGRHARAFDVRVGTHRIATELEAHPLRRDTKRPAEMP